MEKGTILTKVFIVLVCVIALLSIGHHIGYKEGFDNTHMESHCPKPNCIQEIQNKLIEAGDLRNKLVEVINDTKDRPDLQRTD